MVATDLSKCVWVFVGDGAHFPCGAFVDFASADQAARRNKLSGVLTAYPLDILVYDWAVANSSFRPTEERHSSPKYIQQFTSAVLEHYHYHEGERDG